MKKSTKSLLFKLVLATILSVLLFSCSVSKTTVLKPGRYTYHQIKAAGYTCTPFKGCRYISPTSDSSIANIFPIK